MAILEAIGTGAKSPSGISEITGVPINHIGKYLHTLLSLNFIRRIISLDAKDYNNTRQSLIRNLFRHCLIKLQLSPK